MLVSTKFCSEAFTNMSLKTSSELYAMLKNGRGSHNNFEQSLEALFKESVTDTPPEFFPLLIERAGSRRGRH